MNRWICDSCGQEITSVEDGWVEWISLDSGMIPSGRGLRLVHKSPSCQYNQKAEHRKDGGILSDSSLSDFLGSDGLMRLLQLLSEEEVPKTITISPILKLRSDICKKSASDLIAKRKTT